MMRKLSKLGFREQKIKLTDGPVAWTDRKGRKHGEYYILYTKDVNVELEPTPPTVTDSGNEIEHVGPIRPVDAQTALPSREARSGDETVKIESDPPGAEMYVDGNLVGQTPAVIPLGLGMHRLRMKAQGKRAWEKELEVWKDSQNSLHPLLESFSDVNR